MKKNIMGIAVVLIMMMLCACGAGGGIQSKWYQINDDDFWMDISAESIGFYSVHTDELVAKGDVSISDNTFVISRIEKYGKGARCLPEGTYTYDISGDTLSISQDGGYRDTFSTDIGYKYDH